MLSVQLSSETTRNESIKCGVKVLHSPKDVLCHALAVVDGGKNLCSDYKYESALENKWNCVVRGNKRVFVETQVASPKL